MTEPTPALRLLSDLAPHPADPILLWIWEPFHLHSVRLLRVGPWVVDDDGEMVWLLDAIDVARLDRMPRAVHDGNPWLCGESVAETVASIERAIAKQTQIAESRRFRERSSVTR